MPTPYLFAAIDPETDDTVRHPDIRVTAAGDIERLTKHPEHTPIMTPIVIELERDEEDKEKGRIGLMVFPLRGPKETIEQAIGHEPPELFTQAMWEQMTLEKRLAAVNAGAAVGDDIVSTDMTKIFPERTSQFLSAWQYLINTGAVWHADYDLGKMANLLMQNGYCAFGRHRVPGYYDETLPSRDDVDAGSPGSMRFVELMMGMEYANWLRGIPS
ncbi:MAG TPA: hypothetical protein VGC34_04225 [Steroidobacteraceae bacterium]